MRRVLLYVFLFFSALATRGQEVELQGKYVFGNVATEVIEFVGKDSFYFTGFYCGLIVEGRGRCEIRGNYMYLMYEKETEAERLRNLRRPIISYQQEAGFHATINFNCIYSDTLPLGGAIIEVLSNNTIIDSVFADHRGQAKLHIRAEKFPIRIKTAAVGVLSKEFEITQAANYSVTIFHLENIRELDIKGKVDVYEIAELNEDMIEMRKLRTTRYQQYRRRSQ